MVAKQYVKFVGDYQDQGAGEDAEAHGAGEDAPAQGAGEDERAPDAGGDGRHSGQGSVLPDLNAMPGNALYLLHNCHALVIHDLNAM